MTTAAPTISVVIPVHNGSKYLGAAIESALRQTYPPIECIVVDDGSTDDSATIAESAGPSVRVIRTQWAGVAAARNLGIEQATGDLIALLDADDLWSSVKLERQVAARAAAGGAALVLTGYQFFVGRRGLGVVRPSRARDPVRAWLALESDGPAFASTALIDRAVLLEAGGFDPALSTSADLDLAWRISRSHRVVAIPDVLVRYRIHDSQMHRDSAKVENDYGRILDRLETDPRVPRRIVRRTRANLEVLLGMRLLLRGEVRPAMRRILRAARLRPDRVVLAPIQGAWRRVLRRVRARIGTSWT